MRILHIITSLRSGGAERLVTEIIPRLKSMGHESEIYVFDATPTPFYKQLEEKDIKIRGGWKGAWQMWNPFHFFKIRKLLGKESFDIVHTHNTSAQLLTAFAKGKSVVKAVTTEHNITNRRRKWNWFRKIDRSMYGRYDHIVCVSEMTKKNLLENIGISFESMISVIANGVDLRLFAGKLRELGKKGNRCVVLMVGAFRKQKDQATLIKAMKHLDNNYVLWLAGGWNGREECMRLAEELKVGHKVEFLGEKGDIPKLLAKADIVVLSSHYEGHPLSAIEAMASGCPLIASDVPGLKEVVEEAGLLFREGDDRQLADLIQRVQADDELRAEVSDRCRERSKQYDINNTVERYANLYLTLLSK